MKMVKKKNRYENNKEAGIIYALGFIGALIYFILSATGFWAVVLGVFKAIVWPAFLVFELFKFLGV